MLNGEILQDIILGDVVKICLPEKSSELQGTVVGIEFPQIKVAFELQETNMPNFYKDNDAIWVNENCVINIGRTFKIINIDEYPDHTTNGITTLLKLTPIEYMISEVAKGYHVVGTFDPQKHVLLILNGQAGCHHLCANPEENKMLWLYDFDYDIIKMDDQRTYAYYPTK